MHVLNEGHITLYTDVGNVWESLHNFHEKLFNISKKLLCDANKKPLI